MRIHLSNIKKAYNGRMVLDVDSLLFEQAKIYAILGPNGSGKSTLLKIIKGLVKPDFGSVVFENNMKSIAYLPQVPYIFNLTVLENVILGMEALKSDNEARLLAFNALEQAGLEQFANQKATKLSGGEAQRMAVVRTLIKQNDFALLDEPAASVDISNSQQLEKLIVKQKNEKGTTIIFTTHNPSQAMRIADEVIIMMEGKIVEKGNPQKVLREPEHLDTENFLKNWRF